MQKDSLLATKLYIPPLRPGLISRLRLLERLNAGLVRKLTLVSAPAGFGKTTLASEWAHGVGAHEAGARHAAPLQVAWLSLDEGDNDPARFLAYVIAALRTIEANIGKGVLSALLSPQPPPAEAVLTSLINEITDLPDKVILVLDDYHLIETQPIHDAFTFLLKHLPPPPGGLHLVVATREDPHLPLARLRARGPLTELRASDLRFSSSEVAEFLNQVMGLDLSAEEIAALEARRHEPNGSLASADMAGTRPARCCVSMAGRTQPGSRRRTRFSARYRVCRIDRVCRASPNLDRSRAVGGGNDTFAALAR
jgi:LuxR family maltose regulon positive regulatory protein